MPWVWPTSAPVRRGKWRNQKVGGVSLKPRSMVALSWRRRGVLTNPGCTDTRREIWLEVGSPSSELYSLGKTATLYNTECQWFVPMSDIGCSLKVIHRISGDGVKCKRPFRLVASALMFQCQIARFDSSETCNVELTQKEFDVDIVAWDALNYKYIFIHVHVAEICSIKPATILCCRLIHRDFFFFFFD